MARAKTPKQLEIKIKSLKKQVGKLETQMKKAVDFRCAICREEVPLAVDHCHTTGSIRGLLCGNCNQGLGRFKDNIVSLNNAIKYLKEFKEDLDVHFSTFTRFPTLELGNAFWILNIQQHTLSPAISISRPYIKSIISTLKSGALLVNALTRKLNPLPNNPKQLGLDELSAIIIDRCIKNDFTSLNLNWEKKHYDYQEFIKQAAAINQAISYFIYEDSTPASMNYTLFMEKGLERKRV